MTRIDIANNFGLNIEHERFLLGYSQAKMAKALDMSLSSYKRILTGETTKIDMYTVHLLYHLTNKLGFELSEEHDPYLDAFHHMRKLSVPQLRTISSLIDFELAFTEDLLAGEQEADYITVLIPTGSMEDGMIYDSYSTEKINIAAYRKRYGDLVDIGMRITSDYLTPVYHRNDVLLICQRPIRDGNTGIFFDKEAGLLHVRRFRQGHPLRLEPINGYGKTICIDSDDQSAMDRWTHIGYVVTKMHSDAQGMTNSTH